jgi:cytochrome c peroxidase
MQAMRNYCIAGISVLSLLSLQVFATVPAPLEEDLKWVLPAVPVPKDNELTPERIELGKKLFFEPRLSGHSNMTCASCHNPSLGWSDGLATARGEKGKVLGRSTPTVVNSAYNTLQMWDGRKKDLEDQATGPLDSGDEMNADYTGMLSFLSSNPQYKADFAKAYPGEAIDKKTLAKAIASFERTVVSNNAPFDRWLKGDREAISIQQYRGFQVFKDPKKGNCAVCHQAPNFTDGGFHNLGLAQFGGDKPDLGRYAQKPLALMKGAFKTPTLREIDRTAPYFHDGSVKTLEEVIEHYVKGGVVKTNLSPNFKPLTLTSEEKSDLVAFMHALTSDRSANDLPNTKTGVPLLP